MIAMGRRLVFAAGVALLATTASLWLVLGSREDALAGAPGGAPLLPDLVVEKPADILLTKSPEGPGAVLRFSHTTSNIGRGPLEIYPDLTTETCGEKGDRGRVAYQAVYLDADENGAFDRSSDPAADSEGIGCMIFHEPHNHYHFEDFALYRLYSERSGRLKATSDKMSFCVYDLNRPYSNLPGSPSSPFYSFANCDRDDGTHGISVGYSDVYSKDTPGQELPVPRKRRAAVYCLEALADPLDRLSELEPAGEFNNIQRVRVRLNPKAATKKGAAVQVLDGPCKSPPP